MLNEDIPGIGAPWVVVGKTEVLGAAIPDDATEADGLFFFFFFFFFPGGPGVAADTVEVAAKGSKSLSGSDDDIFFLAVDDSVCVGSGSVRPEQLPIQKKTPPSCHF
jgi:hypothetical protein